MHDFIEKAKHRGIAMAGQRYFKANNPKMGDAYDSTKPTTWNLMLIQQIFMDGL